MDFETLLAQHRTALERFVRYKLPPSDAEDVLQEVCMTAYRRFGQLKNPEAFKPWLLTIARNRCSDYYRAKGYVQTVPLESAPEYQLTINRFGRGVEYVVRDTLAQLPEKDRRILLLYFWRELSQKEIAEALGIPVGTVKSRLFAAKKSFREHYPIDMNREGEINMKKLPERLPEYTIIPSEEKPFAVRMAELPGWLFVPEEGEKTEWAMYDYPEKQRTDYTQMRYVGRAEVHGIEGIEIAAVQYDPADKDKKGNVVGRESSFIIQMTDTHCRYLAEHYVKNGVRKYRTFLDGEEFLSEWGVGEDNCGWEINLKYDGRLACEGNVITGKAVDDQPVIVGRCRVAIGGREYDTVRVMVFFKNDAVTEQYLDKNGRTVLWRRFNRDDWAIDRYGQRWSEKLPDNERLTINGETYVHWYDCITDYILPPNAGK